VKGSQQSGVLAHENPHTLRDYLHFGRCLARPPSQSSLGKQFEACVRNGSFELPSALSCHSFRPRAATCASVLQSMGRERLFPGKAAREVATMMKAVCRNFVEQLSPQDY